MLQTLREKLQALSEPSREVDAELFLILTPPSDGAWRVQRPGWLTNDDREGSAQWCPHFTASIDAALALVERMLPGWQWLVGRNEIEPKGTCYLLHARKHSYGSAPTPALAILLALLDAIGENE